MADRDALIKGFLKRNAKGTPPKKGGRIMEDDPRWNPATMGNKRWGKGYRGALNYSKGKGTPELMASTRDRLARSATTRIPPIAKGVADVVSGRALGRNLAGGVKFPNPPKAKRQVTYLAGTRPPRPRARSYTKGAGRPD